MIFAWWEERRVEKSAGGGRKLVAEEGGLGVGWLFVADAPR